MKKMEVLHDDGSSAHIRQFKLFFFLDKLDTSVV